MQTRRLHAVAVLAGFAAAGAVFVAIVAQLIVLRARVAYEGDISLGAANLPWLVLPWLAFVAILWRLPRPAAPDLKLALLHRAMRWFAIAAPLLSLLFLIFAGASIRWRF